MDKPQSNSPRDRLQALRKIPERQRTDAEWDELNELEISQAVRNPVRPQDQGGGGGNRNDNRNDNRGQQQPHANTNSRAHAEKRFKSAHKRFGKNRGSGGG